MFETVLIPAKQFVLHDKRRIDDVPLFKMKRGFLY